MDTETLRATDRSQAPLAPPAHGGTLVDRLLPREGALDAAGRALELHTLQLSPRSLSDLEMIAVGAFSPLRGFMLRDEYRSVLGDMRLASGAVWPLPVLLPVDEGEARGLRDGQEVALASGGQVWGLLTVEDVFRRDLAAEVVAVYGTEDPSHPGVRQTSSEPLWAVGGVVSALGLPPSHFPSYRLVPRQIREMIAVRGWQTVAGFQTRNPVHRAHEYIQKCALEVTDGLLLHPLVGATKADDVPADVRLRSYETLLHHYYPADRVILSTFGAAMRYAGPREAVFHALCRKNYGCTHFIVGRDHAGVGQFYGPFAAQELALRLEPELGIRILAFDNAFYCRRCQSMATAKTCPHDASDRISLSGTAVRAMLRAGELPPPEFSRPEVAAVLMAAMRA